MTIREILTEGKTQLTKPCSEALIESSSLDAALLLAKVLKTNRETLISRSNEIISEGDREKFFKLLERRRSGECVAYLLGYKEFRGLKFVVNPSVLVPRPDTEILVEAALEYIDSLKAGSDSSQKNIRISLLDLCTGSGALAISLKNERPFLSVSAADISEEALDIARVNAQLLLTEANSAVNAIRFIRSDLFEKFDTSKDKFHIIVSNPPYIPSEELALLAPEVRREPALALDGGQHGLDLIYKIISQAADYLHEHGILLLEAGSEQIMTIITLLENQNFSNIKIHRDLAGRDRVISAQL